MNWKKILFFLAALGFNALIYLLIGIFLYPGFLYTENQPFPARLLFLWPITLLIVPFVGHGGYSSLLFPLGYLLFLILLVWLSVIVRRKYLRAPIARWPNRTLSLLIIFLVLNLIVTLLVGMLLVIISRLTNLRFDSVIFLWPWLGVVMPIPRHLLGFIFQGLAIWLSIRIYRKLTVPV